LNSYPLLTITMPDLVARENLPPERAPGLHHYRVQLGAGTMSHAVA